MKEKDKYGFNLDWFASNSSYREIEKLDACYEKYFLDYKKFIDSLNIPQAEKEKCLLAEEQCLLCKNKYPYCNDSFIHIYSNGHEITSKLCFDCIALIEREEKEFIGRDIDPWQRIDYKISTPASIP